MLNRLFCKTDLLLHRVYISYAKIGFSLQILRFFLQKFYRESKMFEAFRQIFYSNPFESGIYETDSLYARVSMNLVY